VDAARGVLNKFLPDVYIFTDHHPGDGREGGKGAARGKKSSPGFGLSLVAETTTGCLLGADAASGAGRAAWEEGVSAFGDAAENENDENENGAFALGASGAGGRKRHRGEPATPEDLGASTTEALMAEVQRGGVCDSAHQPLVLLLMAIGPEQLSKVRLGRLTPRAVKTLRVIKAFFGVTFDIRPEPDSGTVFLSTVGAGIRNIARRAT
jgi:RNA 3'-terminal phosphate cyclase-like protein